MPSRTIMNLYFIWDAPAAPYASIRGKDSFEEGAGLAADLLHHGFHGSLAEGGGHPAMHELRHHRYLGGIRRKPPFGVAGCDAEAMINCTEHGSGIAEKSCLGRTEPAGFHDNVDALRRVERLVEAAGIAQPQVHQHEVDVVIAARTRLQRIAHALLFFEPPPHVRELLARSPRPAITLPVDLLQLAQKRGALLDVTGDRARLHVGKAFPRLRFLRKVFPVSSLGLDQRAFASVRPQAGIDGEYHPI